MKSIFFVSIFLISFSSFGQLEPFKDINFNDGGYYLLGKYAEGDKNSLRDSLREWYIDHIQTLNELKELWKFDEETPFYACGYHYTVILCKNGEAIRECRINLNCNTIVSDGKSYLFDSNKLRYIFRKTKRFYQEKKKVNIIDGRKYMDSIRDNPKLIYAPYQDWMRYEGEFEFTYHYAKGTQEYFPSLEKKIKPKLLKYCSDSIIEKIRIQIRNTYPDEDFELTTYGGSLTEIFLRVTANKSLEEKFNLYPRTEYEKWEYFDPWLDVYWIMPY